MTRAQERTYGVMTPWFSQPLLAAMLCLLAERVLNAAAILWMLMSRLSGECHADVPSHRLPGGKNGIAKKEQQQEQHRDTDAARAAAVVATRSVRVGTISPSAAPLIQNGNPPAVPAAPTAPAEPAEPAAAAAGSKIAARIAAHLARLGEESRARFTG